MTRTCHLATLLVLLSSLCHNLSLVFPARAGPSRIFRLAKLIEIAPGLLHGSRQGILGAHIIRLTSGRGYAVSSGIDGGLWMNRLVGPGLFSFCVTGICDNLQTTWWCVSGPSPILHMVEIRRVVASIPLTLPLNISMLLGNPAGAWLRGLSRASSSIKLTVVCLWTL
jgi:hypothetical protein